MIVTRMDSYHVTVRFPSKMEVLSIGQAHRLMCGLQEALGVQASARHAYACGFNNGIMAAAEWRQCPECEALQHSVV